METSMEFPQKLKTGLPYDPGIPLQNIYIYICEKTKTLIQKDTCTSVFIAALCTIAKARKQPSVH